MADRGNAIAGSIVVLAILAFGIGRLAADQGSRDAMTAESAEELATTCLPKVEIAAGTALTLTPLEKRAAERRAEERAAAAAASAAAAGKKPAVQEDPR